MATMSLRRSHTRLLPDVNRVLYVRNLPFNITSEEMYDIFGKYGAIRQVRVGTNKETRGTAYVVYEDIYGAKAVDHLTGFNVANRYLIVVYYQKEKMSKKIDQKKKEEELNKLQEKYGVTAEDLKMLQEQKLRIWNQTTNSTSAFNQEQTIIIVTEHNIKNTWQELKESIYYRKINKINQKDSKP